jgi:hypothetical protein
VVVEVILHHLVDTALAVVDKVLTVVSNTQEVLVVMVVVVP